MIIEQTISDDRLPGDPQHDPAGDAIQTHALESGELLLTFSDEFIEQMDWRVGETLVWDINEETGGLTLSSPQADARRALQDQADVRRQEIEDYDRMAGEGAPI